MNGPIKTRDPYTLAIGLVAAALLTVAVKEPEPTLHAQAYAPGRVDYDIVYVRQPRYGDVKETIWPEVFHPARNDPGADLMLLRPNGSEEVLFRGGDGAVTDPFISFDGSAVYFSYFHDVRPMRLILSGATCRAAVQTSTGST